MQARPALSAELLPGALRKDGLPDKATIGSRRCASGVAGINFVAETGDRSRFFGVGKYVALLRGIGPVNPNMRNEKLCSVVENLGCTNVQPVLASGNLVFQSTARSTAALEAKIEKALREKLGLACDVMVRGQTELEEMVRKDPFKGAEHGKEWYLTVTFRKDGPPVFEQLVRSEMDGPEFMAELGRRHGKRITTRTWNTVLKILAKMQGGPR